MLSIYLNLSKHFVSKAILVKVIFQRSDNLPCPWKLLKTFETIISLFTNMCIRQSQKPAVNTAAKQTNAKLIKICICLTQITYRKSPSNHQTPLEEFLTCTRNTIKKLKSIRFSHGSPVLSLLVLFISMSCAELIMRQDKKKSLSRWLLIILLRIWSCFLLILCFLVW